MTARQFLDDLDRRMARLSEGVRTDVWLVLAALRGPDHGNLKTKARTTARLRAAAFPTSCIPAMVRQKRHVVVPRLGSPAHREHKHFYQHVRQAAKVLGLTIRVAPDRKP